MRFATKPALARRMIARTVDAGVPAAWVTGDEVCGADPGLRADLDQHLPGAGPPGLRGRGVAAVVPRRRHA